MPDRPAVDHRNTTSLVRSGDMATRPSGLQNLSVSRYRSRSSVRIARNPLRVGRTLLQRWWGEAVLAKVRLHVPVDYFRIAEQIRPLTPVPIEASLPRG